jgi:hypothetical protein
MESLAEEDDGNRSPEDSHPTGSPESEYDPFQAGTENQRQITEHYEVQFRAESTIV